MNSGPLMRETMVQNWSVLGAISRRRTSTSSIVFGLLSNENLDERQRHRHPTPPQEPVGGSRRIGRKNRSCQTISHSQVVMEPITGPPSRIAYCAGDGEGPVGRGRAGRRPSAERRRRGRPAAGVEAVPGAGRTTQGGGSARGCRWLRLKR